MTSDSRKGADDHPPEDKDLPVTAEVGGEGGSFADATYQRTAEEGFTGPGLEREDEPPGEGDAAGNATRSDHRAGHDPETAAPPREDVRKFPTE